MLLIFRYRRQNISVSVTLISAVTGPQVTFADMTGQRFWLLPHRRVRPSKC